MSELLKEHLVLSVFGTNSRRGKLFLFFWRLVFKEYFHLADEDKRSLLVNVKALGRKLKGRDFISPKGALFGYFLAFQHGDRALMVLSSEAEPEPERISLFKRLILKYFGRVYGTCSANYLWKKICSRLLFPTPGQIVIECRENESEHERIRLALAQLGVGKLDVELFATLLPVEFYSEPVSGSLVEFVSAVHGNVYEILANPFIFLSGETPPKIFGYQHGGVYGEWQDNYLEQAEISVYDQYWGWLEKGVTRFNKPLIGFFCLRKKSIEQVMWVARPHIGTNVSGSFSYLNHLQDLTSISYISRAVPSLPVPVSLKLHPRSSPGQYQQALEDAIVRREWRMPEKILNDSYLVLLDCHSHTLFYFCLKYRLPFLLVAPREVPGLTWRYQSIVNELAAIGLVIDCFEDDSSLARRVAYVIENWRSIRLECRYRRLVKRVLHG